MIIKKQHTLFIIFILLFLTTSMKYSRSNSIEREYWPTNDWLTSSLREANLNQSRIEDMFEYIEDNSFDIDSILVVKNGNLTIEEYLTEDYNSTDLHSVYSVTKSVTSALIGIAIEEGFIANLNQKVVDFFPNRTILNLDDDKEDMVNLIEQINDAIKAEHFEALSAATEELADIIYYLDE